MNMLWVHDDNTGVRVFIEAVKEIIYDGVRGKSTRFFEISVFKVPITGKADIEIFPANEKFEVISYKPFISGIKSFSEAVRTLEEMEK